jgi:hypothetical protein
VAVHWPIRLGRQRQHWQQEQTENASEGPEFQVRIPRFQIFVLGDELMNGTPGSPLFHSIFLRDSSSIRFARAGLNTPQEQNRAMYVTA